MKHTIASLTIGTCLLIASTGALLAANPHTFTGTKGQPGTTNGITCNQTVGYWPRRFRQREWLPVQPISDAALRRKSRQSDGARGRSNHRQSGCGLPIRRCLLPGAVSAGAFRYRAKALLVLALGRSE